MEEYIIINKTAIQKRIEDLKKNLQDEPNPFLNISYQTELDTLEKILSQSTPLIPEVEKAILFGHQEINPWSNRDIFISNLKLDI